MPDSTSTIKKPQTEKPEKPWADFPLFPHATKRWAKKVKGKTHYFGHWDDPEAALDEWNRVKDYLLRGLPRPAHRPDANSVADICDLFLIHRHEKVEQGKLRNRTFNEYKNVCLMMCDVFGKERLAEDLHPQDFGQLRSVIAKGRRPKTIHNLITRCMAVVNFSNANGFTERPILTGKYFEKPSAAELRIDRAAQEHMGDLMIEAEKIQDVLKLARPAVKAMILLAINVGLGNEDCGRLEFRHVDLDTGWLDFPRPKSGVKRRAKLWPETVKAILEAIKDRCKPRNKQNEKYVFITRYGLTWFKETNENPISREFTNLLKKAKCHIRGIGFYSLRRTFETVASEGVQDQPAIDLSMGHESPTMSSLYRQRLGDRRLEAVAKSVREWLFGDTGR